ncbi:MAG: hypothetical protein V1747_08980 [Candidatus Omnitrophota bacterium]
MKKIDYLKTVFINLILILLFWVGFSFAQQGTAKSLWLDADRFNPNALDIAAYNVIVSKQFIDKADATRFADPSGQSAFRSLRVHDGLYFDNSEFGSMVMGNGGAYSINFEDFSGDTRLGSLHASILTMDDPGAGTDFRTDGKFVYDIAEGISVESGNACDVVVISQDKDLSVTRSTVKFDSKVAGVISENPKIFMGPAAGSKPLALAGIVRCNVSAENGAIKRGDILVTSSQPGYAMKADDDQVLPGMVVGSALDALEQGKGKIYILIN